MHCSMEMTMGRNGIRPLWIMWKYISVYLAQKHINIACSEDIDSSRIKASQSGISTNCHSPTFVDGDPKLDWRRGNQSAQSTSGQRRHFNLWDKSDRNWDRTVTSRRRSKHSNSTEITLIIYVGVSTMVDGWTPGRVTPRFLDRVTAMQVSLTFCLSLEHPVGPNANIFWDSWRSGVVVIALASINEVNQRRAQLVLRWVTVSGFNSRCRTFISVCNQPATQGQLSRPSLRGR